MPQYIDSFLYNIKKEFQNVDLSKLIIYMIIAAVVIHICIYVYAKIKSKKISIGMEILVVLMAWYIGMVLSVTYFNRPAGSVGRVFQTKLLQWEDNMNQNVTNILNIILFVPFGMLITGLESKQGMLKKIIIIACSSFLFSLLIETMKYITQRGYFEVDNIEANLIGAIAGSIIVSLVEMADTKKEGADIEEDGK